MFQQTNVRYSHWKSNFSLEQSLSGDLDLDLLVDRNSLTQAQIVLGELGFKPATVRWGAAPPAIYHYYGLDEQTGNLIHVHLFSSLITGESFVKSHLFPFETMMLEKCGCTYGIRTASKTSELLLFVLRNFIKYGSLLDLPYQIKDESKIKAEIEWLEAGANREELLELLRTYCPVIDEKLFFESLETLKRSNSLAKRIRLAWQVRRQLQPYAKHTVGQRLFAYLDLLAIQLRRRIAGKKNKMLQAGGAVIAIVGPEATGKSTLVSSSHKWLGEAFAVDKIHAGKPPSTWLTIPINVLLPWLRKTMPNLRTTRVEKEKFAPLENKNEAENKNEDDDYKEKVDYSLLYALRAVALAWDRRHLLIRAHRAAATGEIVICDRYPSELVGAMDSPRLEVTGQTGRSVVYHWLAKLENRIYREIPPPDLVMRLRVSLETAKQRNRDRIKPGKESDAYLEFRHRQIGKWHKAGTKKICDIDTEQSLEETLKNVKRTIWQSL